MKKTIADLEITNKRVIIRVDFNVPIENGKIVDDTRIVESLNTIKYALDRQAKVILLSHLGRIREESDKEKNTLAPVAVRLSELLKRPVIFINRTRSEKLKETVNSMKPGEIILIENTRFEDLDDKKESNNDSDLAGYWANLGEIFINDAFGTIHRKHASNVGIASLLPSAIGFLVEKELYELSKLNDPKRPYIVILGGSKIKDKIGVIEKLIKKADKMIIGGSMAFTFLKALGNNVGNSLVEEEYLDFCRKIIEENPNKILLPIDIQAAINTNYSTPSRVIKINEIAFDEIGLDIGPESVKKILEVLKEAKTVVWNGPLGMYEIAKYCYGTEQVLKIITALNLECILGGGDIVACATKLGYKNKISHASTGGGATLEYLEGKVLPGLEAIKD